MTVLEVIQRSTDYLGRKGVESPRLQAELLLAHILGLPRMKLYLNFERTLSEAELAVCRELVRRRGRREPLQHILGSTCFCGLDFTVNRHALIPRPETELLAEEAWNFLQQLAGHPAAILSPQAAPYALREQSAAAGSPPQAAGGELAVLDFGTGSGCVAVTIASHCPAARVLALDSSPDALALARQNAQKHQVADRIQFLQSSGFSGVPADMTFDLVVSNPPYIPAPEIPTLEPEVRDHDPRAALDGGADGLDFFRLLAAEAGPRLKHRGRLMAEFGAGQAEALRNLFAPQNWIVEKILEDYTHRPRILIARING